MPEVTKRRKIKAQQRREVILALQLQGKTQEQIAAELGVSRRTINRDLDEMQPSVEVAKTILQRAQDRIRDTMPVEKRVDNYVELAMSAKNEAVRQGATQRLDDLDGIVPERELIRAKGHEPQAVQPMFVLPPGARIAVAIDTRPAEVKDGSLPDQGPEST
jgi:transcriptional regulator with XRE-family HTH domain